MIKYSFIVPVYNTEEYLEKCLDSLVKQSFKNFEIIIVNDGSPDNSKVIIEKYKSKHNNIKVVEQKNKGLSIARNNGVKKAAGEYIIFIDSDDYVDKNILKIVDKNIEDVDILRFQVILKQGEKLNKYEEESFEIINGKDAFEKISSYYFVEPAWCYVFKKDYFVSNKYEFKKGIYHEDFALIPYVIYNASKVKSIKEALYYYIVREGSIINNKNYDKTLKKAYDMLNAYIELKNKFNHKGNNYDNYFLSYISNCAVVKARELNKKERKEYIKILKENNVFDDILVNSLSRKIKKVIMRVSLELYLKVAK